MRLTIHHTDKSEDLSLENTTIQVVLKSLIFFESLDSEKLTGDHVFPFSILANQENLAILKYPNNVSIDTYVNTFEATLQLAPNKISNGKVRIKGSTEKNIKLSFQGDITYNLKGYTMQNLPLGEMDVSATIAKQTAQNPLDYPAIFFPVLNKGFFPDDSQDNLNYHNYFKPSTQQFELSEENPVITPFIRIDKILSALAQISGYTMLNHFQVNDTWKKLVTYSNKSVTKNNYQWPSKVNLGPLLSESKLSQFLRKLSSLFCLGIFLDHQAKTIKLLPLKSLLASDDILDITSFASARYSYSDLNKAPEIFATKEPALDTKGHKLLHPTKAIGQYATEQVLLAESPVKNGLYYAKKEDVWYERSIAGEWDNVVDHTTFGMTQYPDNIPEGEKINGIFWSEISPLQQRLHVTGSRIILSTPTLRHEGNMQITATDKEIDLHEDSEERLILYRGYGVTSTPEIFPFASKDPMYGVEGPSLSWNGPTGIYNTWWRQWHNVLKSGKILEIDIKMPKEMVTALRMDRLYRIKSNNYIPISFAINLQEGKNNPIRAKLLRIP